MSRVFVLNHRLQTAFTMITVHPLTMACWMKTSTYGMSPRALMLLATGTTSIDDGWRLEIGDNSTAAKIVAATRRNSTALGVSPVAVADANWHHAAGVFLNSNSRSAYLDGANKGTNTGSATPNPTQDGLYIGERNQGSADFNGSIAHPAIWNVALSDDEIAALGAGKLSPLAIRPQNLVFYAPYLGRDASEIDIMYGRMLTVTGATASDDNPPMMLPRGPR